MSKHIVAVRVQYSKTKTVITPMVRTDRGTRVMVPGSVEVPKSGDTAAHRTDVLAALTAILPTRVVVG